MNNRRNNKPRSKSGGTNNINGQNSKRQYFTEYHSQSSWIQLSSGCYQARKYLTK